MITAADGEEALAGARQDKPDLILLDVMMPKLNGIKVLVSLEGFSRPIAFYADRGLCNA
jgi:DNA-binding response OmpR family regulator